MTSPTYIVARIADGITTELDRFTDGDPPGLCGDARVEAHAFARTSSGRVLGVPVYVCREEGSTMALLAAYENGHRLMYSGEPE